MSLTGCPSSETPATASETGTGTTGGTTQSTSSATGTPISGEGTGTGTGTATDSEATEDAPTTGDPPMTGVERILYLEGMDMPQVNALRAIEVVDGIASPPFTVLAAPEGSWLTSDTYSYGPFDRPWMAWFTPAPGPANLWLIDVATLTAHEVPLPPEIERVMLARFTHDQAGLIVISTPIDDNSGDNLEYYVCAIGAEAACTLSHVDPPVPAMSSFGGVSSLSGAGGWIVYPIIAEGGPGTELFLGDLAEPANATSIATFPLDMGVGTEYSPDGQTMYLSVGGVHDRYALDIGSDPPGPLVELHPTLTTTTYRAWNDDMTGLLFWEGEELFGDLHVQSVNGTAGGPLLKFHAAAPGHVQRKSYKWSPDGSRVLFSSDHETPMDAQLYLAASAAPEPAPVKLNGPLGPGGRVLGADFLPDEHVLYYAVPEDGASMALFRASIEPAGDVVRISPQKPDFGGLVNGGHDVSTDGRRIVFQGSEVPNTPALFMVDIVDGEPTPAVNLTASLSGDTGFAHMGYLLPGARQVVVAVDDGSLAMITLDPQPQPPVQISDLGETVGFFVILPPL